MGILGRQNFSQWSDEQLVEALYAGNQEVVVYFFYKKFSPTFQYHIYRLFEFREDVSELVDEFFLYLYQDDWKRLRTFDASKSSLATWISTVSFRFFRNYKENELGYGGRITPTDKWETIHTSWVEDQSAAIMMDLHSAIDSIKNERDRQIAVRIFLEDREFEAVAQEFGMSVDYVYTVKNRLVKQLKLKLG